MRQSSKILVKWAKADMLELRLKDASEMVIYKRRINVGNKNELAEAFTALEKYGIKMSEITEIIKNKRDRGGSWFGYPLGEK